MLRVENKLDRVDAVVRRVEINSHNLSTSVNINTQTMQTIRNQNNRIIGDNTYCRGQLRNINNQVRNVNNQVLNDTGTIRQIDRKTNRIDRTLQDIEDDIIDLREQMTLLFNPPHWPRTITHQRCRKCQKWRMKVIVELLKLMVILILVAVVLYSPIALGMAIAILMTIIIFLICKTIQ